MKTAKEIREAKVYSDLFSSDEAVAKKEFRAYCKLYHPDVDDSKNASELYGIVERLYRTKASKSIYNSTVEQTVIFKNKETGKGFEMKNPIEFSTGMSLVYHTATKIAIVFDKSFEKFYKNYLKRVKDIKYADDSMRKEFERYFPKVIKHFETEDDKLCILLNKTSEVLNLGKIYRAYMNKGEKFPDRQAAWIMNRLYNIECMLDYNKMVSNGLSIDNLWVSPEMHTVLMLDGWEYTTNKDGDMIGCPKDVYKILPIKVKDSKLSQTITDLESIKAIGRKLFAGHDRLKHINDFLNSGVSSDDPLDEWKKYTEALEADFGKRTFVIWDNVPYN